MGEDENVTGGEQSGEGGGSDQVESTPQHDAPEGGAAPAEADGDDEQEQEQDDE